MRRVPLVVFGLLTCAPAFTQRPALTEQSLERWLAAYESAWEQRDASAAAQLFSNAAAYYETPYAEPFVGRDGIAEYWASVTADQSDIDFQSRIIAVNGNVGVAQWSATFVTPGGPVALDGVFVLEFDADARCTELREWWVLGPASD